MNAQPGDVVVYLETLGVVRAANDIRFVENVTVGQGDTGTYVEPYNIGGGGETPDWHLTTFVDVDGTTYYVPVHESHFELQR